MNLKNILFNTSDWFNPFKNIKNDFFKTDLRDIFSMSSLVRINGLPTFLLKLHNYSKSVELMN